MPDNASRRGAVDMGMPLMIVAFLVIGGFMWWLKGQSDAEMAARVVNEEVVDEAPIGGEADVQLGEMLAGADPTQFVGQTIRALGYEVASQLGTQGFWVNTPSGNPFLVAWTEELRASGQAVAQGDTVSVVGELLEMEISFLDEWIAEGTITENDRIVAEFATHFVAADEVRVTGAANDGGEGGGD